MEKTTQYPIPIGAGAGSGAGAEAADADAAAATAAAGFACDGDAFASPCDRHQLIDPVEALTKEQKNGVALQGKPCSAGADHGKAKKRMAEKTPPPQEAALAAATPNGNTPGRRFSGGTAAAAAAGCTDMKNDQTTPAGSIGGTSSSNSNSQSATAATCESPLCNKTPSFAHRGQTRRRFCKRHAEPGMLNVYYKYCDSGAGQCLERASFEASGKLRCLLHCEPGMRPRNNICQVEGGGCTRQSSYGWGGGKPILCTLHKVTGMVQVRTKTCKCQGCEKIPSYGYPCKSREYCKSHALEGMVYSAGRRCRFRGCCAPGAFNYPGYARGGSFCNDHKEEGMLDSTPKQCESAECNYSANFGDTAQRTRRFCARHRLGGMLSYQELWPRPDKETTEAKAFPTSAEKHLTAAGMVLPSLAATAALSSATAGAAVGVVGVGAATAAAAAAAAGGGSLPGAQTVGTSARDTAVRPGQPRKAQSSSNVRRAKKTRTATPPSDQLATAPHPSALSSAAAAAAMLPQGLGPPGLAGASILTVTGVAGGAPPPAQSPLVGTVAGASATPKSSAMDLAFLADAAAAATPTLGALGLYPAGYYNQSPAATAVASLRGSEAPVAQVQAEKSSTRVDVTAATTSTAAAAAAYADSGAPILPPSSQEFPSTSVSSSSTSTVTPAAAATTATAGGASGEGSSSMPAYSPPPAPAAGVASVPLEIDLAGGIGLEDPDETEEETFLAFLVNSIDPSDPKTLRVRGAMMSRLKGIGRTTVAG